MKVLVTGSEGFLGEYVCKALEEAGNIIYPVDRKIDEKQDLNHVACYFNLLKILREEKIDVVIHLAALVGLKKCYEEPICAVEDNVMATTRLLQACTAYGGLKKFIYTSTWAVAGKLENPYDITKLAGENMVNSFHTLWNLPTVVLRLGTAYGKGMSEKGVIPTYIRLAKEGKPLIVQGRGEQIRQFTHAEDIAQGFVKALENGYIGRTYYIVSDEVISIYELAKTFGSEIKYMEGRKGDEEYKVISNDLAHTELGWKPKIKLKEGIRRMQK